VNYEVSDQNGFSQTPELMAFFIERFGPYPFDVYGSVLVDFQYGTIEAQTLAQHGPNGATDVAVAHSLAHEWFGNSVSMTTASV
jgi:aminopeptidase N